VSRRVVADFVWPLAVFGALAFVPKVGLDIPKVFDGAVSSPGTLQLLALCLLFGGLALTYDLLFGFTGLLSFGHALYVAIGVYMTNIAITDWHWSFTQALLFTALLAFVVPLVLGTVSLRVGGIAFADGHACVRAGGRGAVHKDPHHWTHGRASASTTKASRRVRRHLQHEVSVLARSRLTSPRFFHRAVVRRVLARPRLAGDPREQCASRFGLRPRAYKLMSFVLGSFLATVGGVVTCCSSMARIRP
jgi:branched-chain amino acid transport system permease protein